MTQIESTSRKALLEAFEKLHSIPRIERENAQITSDEKATNEQKMFDLDYESKKQTVEARKTHSRFVLWVIGIWLTIVLVIIILGGFCPSFHIADNVLIALIGSTTANVLGFYVIILKYFFH